MQSLWRQTAHLPAFPALEGDARTDVLIIGGGLAGILCAYLFQQAGIDYLLLEAENICGKTTQNTTAKITAQHGLCYDRLLRTLGENAARLYLQANLQALERYRALCQNIDCGFQEQDSFVYSLTHRKKLVREAQALQQLGAQARFLPEVPLPFPVAGAVCLPRQAQFHPLQFVAGIAQGLHIYENTRVVELMPGAARTHRGRVQAKRMVVTTHFPFLNKHGGYFLKLYPHRSYMLALRGAPELTGMYVDENPKGLSLRRYGELLILGGGGHRTGKKGGCWQELSAFAQRHFPGAQEAFRWSAQDCMPLDGIPYIGSYSRGTPELFVATGFNKWGMTSSMVAASLLCELIQGRDSPLAPLFSPARSILHPQLAANAAQSLLGLLRPTLPRCPHMGCALHYNRQEHSWDCPCHGSRFEESGRLLEGPATDSQSRPHPFSP